MAQRTETPRDLEKRGYELGSDKGYELGDDRPAPDKLPPVRDPGPGAGAKPKTGRSA